MKHDWAVSKKKKINLKHIMIYLLCLVHVLYALVMLHSRWSWHAEFYVILWFNFYVEQETFEVISLSVCYCSMYNEYFQLFLLYEFNELWQQTIQHKDVMVFLHVEHVVPSYLIIIGVQQLWELLISLSAISFTLACIFHCRSRNTSENHNGM